MKNNEVMINGLKALLANQFVLYTKLRNYHWNVEGNAFFRLHILFEELYNELANDIDIVAERIRILGFYAPGSLSEFLSLSSLKESDATSLNSNLMLTNVINDFESVNNNILTLIEEKCDVVTEGILITLSEKYQKHLWMLKSTLK